MESVVLDTGTLLQKAREIKNASIKVVEKPRYHIPIINAINHLHMYLQVECSQRKVKYVVYEEVHDFLLRAYDLMTGKTPVIEYQKPQAPDIPEDAIRIHLETNARLLEEIKMLPYLSKRLTNAIKEIVLESQALMSKVVIFISTLPGALENASEACRFE